VIRVNRWGVACAVVLSVVLLTAGSASAAKVPTTDYVAGLCTSLIGWQGEIQEGSATVEADMNAATSIPDLKTTFVSFLDTAVSTGRDALDGLEEAGDPDVKNGPAIAGVVRKAFAQMVDTFDDALSDAKSLPTGSAARFQSGMKKINKHLDAASGAFSKSFDAAEKKYDVKQLDDAFDNEPACSAMS